MGVFEIASAVLLIATGVVMIAVIMMQDSKGKGLSGAIGGSDMMYSEGRTRTTDALMVKITKYAAIILFLLTLVVNMASILFK